MGGGCVSGSFGKYSAEGGWEEAFSRNPKPGSESYILSCVAHPHNRRGRNMLFNITRAQKNKPELSDWPVTRQNSSLKAEKNTLWYDANKPWLVYRQHSRPLKIWSFTLLDICCISTQHWLPVLWQKCPNSTLGHISSPFSAHVLCDYVMTFKSRVCDYSYINLCIPLSGHWVRASRDQHGQCGSMKFISVGFLGLVGSWALHCWA